VVRLLADPLRWWLMRELATGDQRVRELPAAVGQPQNLCTDIAQHAGCGPLR
jgi:hypothetical protein